MAKVAPADAQVTIPATLDGAHPRHVGGVVARIFGTNPLQSFGWYDLLCVVFCRRLLRGKWFTVVMLGALFVALFLHDIFVAAQVQSSVELDIMLSVVFGLFCTEFVGLILSEATYPLSFFFWMDLAGTALMVLDISYMAGTDATKAEVKASAEPDAIMIVRTTRIAKLAARAGRLSRVMKMLRLVPFGNKSEEERQVKMAKVISNQLTNGLSTRVAFLAICIAVCVPLLGIWLYPADDDSMEVWADLLSRNAELYDAALASGNATRLDLYQGWFEEETRRFSEFFSGLVYGPFDACYGSTVNGEFLCQQPGTLNLEFTSSFEEPARKASILEIKRGHFQAKFNLVKPKMQEALANIGLICFVILVMCGFGLMVSKNISSIALEPLERMLTAVRNQCAQIFKYTDEMRAEDEVEEFDDTEQTSEFKLLERVVSKLANIVKLTTSATGPEVKGEMTENDVMVLNWMQGDPLPQASTGTTTAAGKRSSSFHAGPESDNGSNMDVHQASPESENPREDSALASSLGPIPKELLNDIETDHFDAFDLTKETKINVCFHLVAASPGSSGWVRTNVKEAQLLKFVVQVEGKYQPNPFHSFSHGVDVVYQIYRFMKLVEADRFLPDVTQFWLLIAAAAHDVGHLGVNNQYLIETSHELAVRYNDRAPLENLHCATLFQIVSDPEANIFSQLDKEMYKDMRKSIIHVILHTDMAKHFEMVNQMALLYQMNSEAFDALDPSAACTESQANVQLVLSVFLHGADIANPMKPWKMAEKLAYLCIDEFFAQGDLEKAASIPVQMLNDRDRVNKPNSQVGFVEFVIAPMAEGMINLFPPLEHLAVNLEKNIQHWARIWKEQHSPPADEISKVDGRVQKIQGRLNKLLDRCKELME